MLRAYHICITGHNAKIIYNAIPAAPIMTDDPTNASWQNPRNEIWLYTEKCS